MRKSSGSLAAPILGGHHTPNPKAVDLLLDGDENSLTVNMCQATRNMGSLNCYLAVLGGFSC